MTTGRKWLTHGGARLEAHRTSNQLTRAQCKKLIAAVQAGLDQGEPFNRFITILWEFGGVDARDNARATGHFIKLASDWMRRKNARLKWAWVQEHGPIKGAHVHILLHVPDHLAPLFGPLPLRWTKQVLPGPYRAKTLDSQKIGYSDSQAHLPDAFEAALWGKVHYMLKCAPARLESAVQMTGQGHVRWGQSGTVFGKRMAVWQNRPLGR